MKTLQLFFFILLINFSEPIAYSQILERKISVKFESITIAEALRSISSSEKISFSYLVELHDLTKKVNLSFQNESLKTILTSLLSGTNLFYEEINDIVIIRVKKVKKSHSINGTLEDLASGEQLISASIYDMNLKKGTVSNYYGFYNITLPEGPVKIAYSYVGYSPVTMEFYLANDTTINLKLELANKLEQVVIKSDRISIVEKNQMSKVELSALETKKIPVFLGEPDIMKTIQLLPGIKGGTECSSGVYVRGGSPDQNLILLDGVPLYNTNHLFGFFSVFNSDAIQSFSVLKGGFPAHYGGRLSSVIDIKMKEGNNKKLGGEASLGLISSKLTVEGPIINENTSFIVSARRTYADLLYNFYRTKIENRNSTGGYYFYDFDAKINHKFSNRSRLYYSLYNGQDNFFYDSGNSSNENGSLGWWNLTNALRWNYVINDNLFSNLTLTYSKYKFYIASQHDTSSLKFAYNSGIYDAGIKADFDFTPLPEHYIKFGANYIYHTFKPGVDVYKNLPGVVNKADTSYVQNSIYAHEYFIYAEDDYKVNDKLKVNAGAHFSGFNVKGKNYFSIQPRIMARYLINKNFSVKASVNKMEQYVHLLTNSNIGLPTDLWVPSTNIIKPQLSWQYAIGCAYVLNNKYEFSLEAYYKTMHNLIEYKEGASYLSVDRKWDTKVESGNGRSKGMEFLVNKTSGKVTGWIGYTLAFTDRQFENINFGKRFPYKYDTRHYGSIAITYRPKETVELSATWVYSTGIALTLPERKFLADVIYGIPKLVEYFNGRNGYRMPSYHRLDLGLNFHKKIKWGVRTISLGAYNIYNHKNPFFITTEYNNNGTKKFIQQSLFPIIPYINYSIKF